jgi:hypothetical protein
LTAAIGAKPEPDRRDQPIGLVGRQRPHLTGHQAGQPTERPIEILGALVADKPCDSVHIGPVLAKRGNGPGDGRIDCPTSRWHTATNSNVHCGLSASLLESSIMLD